MRKNTLLFCIGMLLAAVLILAVTHALPLQLASFAMGPNSAPQVIPSLREWHGGTGSFEISASSRIVVDPASAAQLQQTASVFQSDLSQVSGVTLPIVTSSSPQSGDFFLTLQSSDSGLGDEGYSFDVGDALRISAHTTTGVFYGTRTALQILVQDPSRAHVAKGVARDYPQYQERGFMLDVGRKFFPISFLKDYVKFMSWYKMNDFQLHLNDNEINGGDSPDWMQKYAAFRLNSPRFPGLAAKDGSYSRDDIRGLEQVAQAYHMTITPEIDAPAHSLAFTQYRPNLASQKYSKEFLDLNNPASYDFLNSLWNEFLPWFNTSQVHIGADEYSPDDADKFREFVNRYDAYLKGKGKTVWMWGSLSKMASDVPVNTDITVNVWNNDWANPVDMVNAGFHIINTNDNLLYIVPKAGYYHDYLDTQLLYEKWEPYIFSFSDSGLNLRPGDPHLLGGMFAVWNDKLNVTSDAEIHDRVKPAMQVLSQKLWSNATAGISYEQFEQLAQTIGEAPGTHLPEIPLQLQLTPHNLSAQAPGTFPALNAKHVPDLSAPGYIGGAPLKGPRLLQAINLPDRERDTDLDAPVP